MYYRSPKKKKWSKAGEIVATTIGVIFVVSVVSFIGWTVFSIYEDMVNQKQKPKEHYYSPPDFKEWKPVEPPYSTGRY